MVTLLLIIFWGVVCYTPYAPWNRSPDTYEDAWSGFCGFILVITLMSLLISLMRRIEPVITWIFNNFNWLF